MPRFSIHSWNDDGTVNEPWMYPEAMPAIGRLMRLRQTLIPFLYDLLLRYVREGEPMVRPTWLDFPGDPAAWAESDEHLLGRDVLAALVVEPGASERVVRPPAGADWVDIWSGRLLPGGAVVPLPAPLDGPPVLLARAGSGMLVDLARGGWRPEPYRRGWWLFPPAHGPVACTAIEDDGDGDGAVDEWRIEGTAEAETVTLTIERRGPGWGDDRIVLLLPPGDDRRLVVDGCGEPVRIEGRAGVALSVAAR